MMLRRVLAASAQSFVLLIVFRESVTAINCFSCNYSSTATEVTSSCRDAPSSPAAAAAAAAATLNCSGMLCHTVWAEYSSPSNTYRVQECTNSQGDAPSIGDCQGTTVGNKTYFVYQNQCCSTTGEVVNYGTRYRISECYCQTDYCNNVTNPPAVTNSPSSDQPMGYSRTPNDATANDYGKSYSTPVNHENIATSRAVLQRNIGNRVLSFCTASWMSFILITLLLFITLH